MSQQNNNKAWIEIVSKYNTPDVRKSIWQIVNSLGPYMVMWYLMYLSLDFSYWITLGLSVLAAGFLVTDIYYFS